jgi:hypothetical protein
MIMAVLLDLANVIGGFLLAIALLGQLPRVGGALLKLAAPVMPFGWLVGLAALVAGGFYAIVHLTSGLHLFHFEVVGIGVGVALLWDRLTGRGSPRVEADGGSDGGSGAGTDGGSGGGVTGVALLLAVLGIIAMIVGVQGLFTPDG